MAVLRSKARQGNVRCPQKGHGCRTWSHPRTLKQRRAVRRGGLAQALQNLYQTGADAVFGPTIMLDEHLNFIYLFNQITVPRPIDADWHMPVQTCSFLFRQGIWERCPYPVEYRVVGDHIWFRRQMRLGLKLVSIRKPIGLFACTRMTSPNASAPTAKTP